MTTHSAVARFNYPHGGYIVPHKASHIALTALAVAVVACTLVAVGRLDPSYAIAVPLLASVAGLLAALAPRLLLMSLFITAPLLWAFGDASILHGERARVNLPMVVGFVVIVGFCHLLLLKDPDPGIETVRKLVLGMGLACLPSVFFAQELFTGVGGYLRVMCPYIVMFAVLRHVASKADVLRYAKSMAWALASIALLFVIAALRSELWVDFGGYTRLGALYFQTQGLGMYLSVMVLVVLVNYLLSRRKVYLLLLGFPLLALFLTYYRTAWIGGTVVVLLVAFQVSKAVGRRVLLGAAVLLAIFFSFFWQGILRYDTQVDSPDVADKVLSGRLQVDAIAIATYLDAPIQNKIFGIGFFRGKEATGLVLGEEFMIHDDYLALLIEEGIFALAVYVTMLVTLVKRSRQGKRLARDRIAYDTCGAALILLVAVMIMGIPGAFYTDVMSNLYIYAIMGLMLSQSRLLKPLPVQPERSRVQTSGPDRRKPQ